jgi:Flp pilus assembly pilin Flp
MLTKFTQKGQGLVEYALIIMFIALIMIGVVTVLGITIRDVWYLLIAENFPS